LLLAVQIKRAGSAAERSGWNLISPVQRASSWVVYNFEHGWGKEVRLRNTRQDNQALRSELDSIESAQRRIGGPRITKPIASPPS